MSNAKYGNILRQGNVEKEVWNRTGAIIEMLTYGQVLAFQGDATNNLSMMYQGLQLMLDILTPDFVERYDAEGKLLAYVKSDTAAVKKRLTGSQTIKFRNYRQALDAARRLQTISEVNMVSNKSQSVAARDNAYRILQALKYDLLMDCEHLGYNAKLTDKTDLYREGNQ